MKMQEQAVTHPLWLTLSSATFAVAVGTGGALLARASQVHSGVAPQLAWAAIGPWLSAVLSFAPGPAAVPPLAWLPALSLLGALSSLLPLPPVHAGLLVATVAAFALVVASCFWRWYLARMLSSLACAAGIAALHSVSVLAQAWTKAQF